MLISETSTNQKTGYNSHLLSSSLASAILSLSLLSTTKISPSVFYTIQIINYYKKEFYKFQKKKRNKIKHHIYLEVVSPERSDLVLATHVPDCEADVLVLNRLHVEPDGGDGGHDLTQLQLVQDGRLTSCIQTWRRENCNLRKS